MAKSSSPGDRPSKQDPSAPPIAQLRVLLDRIWTAATFNDVAEAAARAAVSATQLTAARVRLRRTDAHGQAVATAGTWESASGRRWLTRTLSAKTDSEDRPLRDRSGLKLGTLSTQVTSGGAVSRDDLAVAGLIAAQAGLAAGYIRLQERNQRLDSDLGAAREELHILQQAWQIAVNEAPDGMSIISLLPRDFSQQLEANDALGHLTQRDPDDLVGTSFLDLLHVDERAAVASALRRAAEGQRSPHRRHTQIMTAAGERRHIRMTITPVLDTDETPQFAVCHIQQLPDEQTHNQPQTLSPADAAAIADQITDAVKSAQRYDTTAAFLLCDLSDLDRILEDTDPGTRQQLMSELAARLRITVRDGDAVGQPDEHTLSVLVADAHASDAHSIAARARAALSQAAHEHGHRITPPVGVAMIDDRSDAAGTIRSATAAMHAARSTSSRISLYKHPEKAAPTHSSATHIIRNRNLRRGGLRH